MSSTPRTGDADPATLRHPGWALFALAFAQLIISLDIYVVFVAMPEMKTALGFSDQTLQWVVSGYAVTLGGFMLLGGRAADLFGGRRMFIAGLALYGLSSLAGGLATNVGTVIAARAVQGIGGAVLFPATLALINTLFAEGRPRNRALAVWGGAGASGLTLGSLLGGVLTGLFGWSAVFFVNVPLAAAAIAVAFSVMPRTASSTGSRTFDLPGGLTVTAGLVLLVYVLVQGPEVGWGDSSIAGAAVGAVVLLAAFFLLEAKRSEPMLPMRLLRHRHLVPAVLITFIFMGTFGAVPYFLTLYFQDVFHYEALTAGLAFLTQAAAIFVGTQIGERLTTANGTRPTLVIGFAIGAIGMLALALGTGADHGYAALVPGLLVMGVGQGIVWTAMWVAAGAGIADREQGVANGLASTTQQAGYAVGLAVFVVVANAGTTTQKGEAYRVALADGTRVAFFAIAAAVLLGLLTSLAIPRRSTAQQTESPATAPVAGADADRVQHSPS
ncbi:MFS transporter [Streptomyces sp. GbtcB6]|uniref:MFS transporter n=1 Tax=Streptomyces sp. GbtcB6 TaxID=2824751 RepID=UPI0027E48CCF|nr:MFS transporter [Streptomyces sp. GbtcB6]